MCFSLEADLVAGVVLAPIGVVTLRAVKRPGEVLVAALPALFAAHQLVETVVWAGVEGNAPRLWAQVAATAYVVFALPVLPTLVPAAVWALETGRRRLAVLPFLLLGLVVSAYMASRILANGVDYRAEPHALVYTVGLQHGEVWTGLYVVAVMGACLVSAHWWMKVFGLINLVGLSVVALLYTQAFASLWCVYAALSSLVIWAHMVDRPRPSRRSQPRSVSV